MSLKYRITCCGKFHYHNYALFLEGKSAELVFSHKRSTLRGLAWTRNLWLKEYLFYAVARLLPSSFYLWAYRIAHAVWKFQLSRAIEAPVQVDYFLCHGNCAPILENRRYRSLRIAAVVNAHPEVQSRLLGIARSQVPESVWSRDFSNVYFERHADRLIGEAKRADYVLCPSNFVRQSFVDHGFDGSRVFVIPYGLKRPLASAHLRLPAFGRDRTLRVVCVGQIMLRKGQHLLLRACERLRTEGFDVELTLIGKPFGSYFGYIKSLGVKFRHVTHMPNDELLTELRNFDLFVLPSLEDGFAVVVAEALDAGLPVVVSRSAGAMELLAAGADSTFEPGSVDDLVSKMKHYVTHGYDEEVRARTWEEYSSELLSLFEELLQRGGQA